MDFLENAKVVAEEIGTEIKEKAIDYVEIAKLKKEIIDEKKRLDDRYIEIGRRYYNKHKDNPRFECITESIDKIQDLEAQIEEIKANSNDDSAEEYDENFIDAMTIEVMKQAEEDIEE